MILNVIGWIIFGLIVGALAKLLVPGNDSNNIITTILLGVAGSFLGGFIGNLLFHRNSEGGIKYGGFIMSLIGAIILLVLYHWIFRH